MKSASGCAWIGTRRSPGSRRHLESVNQGNPTAVSLQKRTYHDSSCTKIRQPLPYAFQDTEDELSERKKK